MQQGRAMDIHDQQIAFMRRRLRYVVWMLAYFSRKLVAVGAANVGRRRRRTEMTRDVLLFTTMDVSGGTKAGDRSPQPYERAEMWAAAVRCVDIDIMCSVGSGQRMFVVVGRGRLLER